MSMRALSAAAAVCGGLLLNGISAIAAHAEPAPVPLLSSGKPVDWWFAYKFSSGNFPYKAGVDTPRTCPFGGVPAPYSAFSQRYVVASAADHLLKDGAGLIGASTDDPLGATFGAIFSGRYYYVVWNDQFYGDPGIARPNCDAKQCGAPWGHAKGVMAWNESGEGVVLQVSTPSWPASGSSALPRKDGNTLGCVSNDNNLSNAQHFFALRLPRADVKIMLQALDVANVVTDIHNAQLVKRPVPGSADAAGLADLDALVAALEPGPSKSKEFLDARLSSGVRLVAKPSGLNVPAWQFLSSVLGGVPLRSATWWASPRIPTTTDADVMGCWDASLPTKPKAVQIATSGKWGPAVLSLTGAPNHAKIGTGSDGAHSYAIFGDLNQQGQLGDPTDIKKVNCASSQNGRGGMFFVVDDAQLSQSVGSLIEGLTGPQTLSSH